MAENVESNDAFEFGWRDIRKELFDVKRGTKEWGPRRESPIELMYGMHNLPRVIDTKS